MEKAVKINCSFKELVDVDELVEHPLNPNHHPEEQIRILAKVIKIQGFRRPIVVSKRSGFVIVGHARLQAAKALKMEKVPVDYQDYENEAKEYADMAADNKIQEMSVFDPAELQDLLQKAGDLDEELFGMPQSEIDSLLGRVNTGEAADTTGEINPEDFDGLEIECPRCHFRFNNHA